MKKSDKQKINDCIALLHQAHKEYQKVLRKNASEQAEALLQSCQQTAIEVGTFIEQIEGEGTKTVSYLEEYCELLFQLCQRMQESDDLKQYKLLEATALKIENSLKYDIPDSKPEMIFLPYKAAMWDSLESIWQAAMEDGRYECHVIPIPYFDKNADGSLGEMHYEGELFPENVPVEPWENYDIDSRCPEVAVIHNPYDNTNRVTSVHPKFYAKIIRKQVGTLVYCPYFLSKETVQEHFCVNPGTMYADYVFVQSEHIRRQYISHFKAFEKEYNIQGTLGNPEEKFIALGSPKIDKVRFFNKEKSKLPKEWETLIHNRKIVLYNTHLSEALNYGAAYFVKLRWVLEYFKNHEQYVLWWRPHPLSQQTMASMRPEILKEYEELVEEYKNEKWGIYDDTADLHRAIGYADIYYGSGGSLVPMFGATGKPVILQDTLSVETNTDRCHKFEGIACIESGKKEYALLDNAGVLLGREKGADENTSDHVRAWQLEAELPVAFKIQNVWNCRSFVDGDKVYIYSNNADILLVKQNGGNNLETVKLEGSFGSESVEKYFQNSLKIAAVCNYRDTLVIVPFRCDEIGIYNKARGCVTYQSKWRKQIEQELEKQGDCFQNIRVHSACVQGDCLYMVAACGKGDRIICISLDTWELLAIYKPVDHGILYYMEPVEGAVWMLWIAGKESSVLLWNPENGVEKRINISEYIFQNNQRAALRRIGDRLYVYPFRGQKIVSIDTDKQEIAEVLDKDSDQAAAVLKEVIQTCDIHENDVAIDIHEYSVRKYLKNINLYGRDMKENNTFLLSDALEILSEAEKCDEKISRNKYHMLFYMQEQTAGSLIYDRIVELTVL